MKQRIKNIVEINDSKASKFFAIFIQVLILISIVTFTLETTPNLEPRTYTIINIIEVFCVLVFTLEYLLRIYVTERKLKFIFSFYGIIDLLAILPFYLSFGFDLRALRALRFLRLFRVFKLVRYNRALNHFSRAIKSSREEIFLFLFITLILIYFSAVGIYYFENEAQPEHFASILDSLWWAIITLTTVGYGDVYPITAGGKIFTFFILLIGLGIVAIPTGIISSALTKSVDPHEEEK
ncbi:ion transporter [Oceanihabitans sediminis]|uniref:Ion transporter n=1 Tax=Oceanihabitans sediminis TaxID=1812012 RepID=A0A368P7K4_9FLAO|nr:ion transporter [Oceanihabitans sediminis]MDX1278766.1 ion transporter [Oceanihabitans sediminis]RBP32164.1 voltage-gated potassium channel [Oceanihabitans sediminis]RCU58812.1 ion transporter [Oceanihabitans sediminis]